MYQGIHVRPGSQLLYSDTQSERDIKCYDTLQAAINAGGENPLIFLHSGRYLDEPLVIDNNIQVNWTMIPESRL